MLLRRLTRHVSEQNWFAVALDFIIVVVGVLFAFQVTEWNELRKDRAFERLALERLIDEYQQNRVLLAEDTDRSQRTLDATRTLLSMIAPEPDPTISDESVAPLLNDCLSNAKLIPSLGVTHSLKSSGQLSLIQSPEIQSALSQWEVSAQGKIEWQEIERVHGEELILGLTFDYLAWPSINRYNSGPESPAESALTSDYQGLFSSSRFEGLLLNRWYNTHHSIKRSAELDLETIRLIELLEARRQALM